MQFRDIAALATACALLAPIGAVAAPGSENPKAAAPQATRHSARRPHDSATCSGAGTGSFVGGTDSNNAYGLDAAVLAGGTNTVCDDYGAIAAGNQNLISTMGNDAAVYSFIGAGESNSVTGQDSAIGAGSGSELSGSYSAIGAGIDNVVTGATGFIGSGFHNVITLSQNAFVGGGDNNQIVGGNNVSPKNAGGMYGVIGGGYDNTIYGSQDGFAQYATVGGGNTNMATGTGAAIAGGFKGTASSAYAAVGGGYGNVASGQSATVGGGEFNAATGALSSVPGGYHNFARGSASFAAGYLAEALANGDFVWSDESSTTLHVKAAGANQFLARAAGGVVFYSNAAMTSGVSLAPGSGAWSNLSDRHMKTGIVGVDDTQILDKVAALPVSEWSYTSERGVRHIGPMAQDFYAAFGVGEDDRHITSVDEDGVALAAVKALNTALHSKTASLEARLAHVEADDAALRREVRQLLSAVREARTH
jgi:hypothetical protein